MRTESVYLTRIQPKDGSIHLVNLPPQRRDFEEGGGWTRRHESIFHRD